MANMELKDAKACKHQTLSGTWGYTNKFIHVQISIWLTYSQQWDFRIIPHFLSQWLSDNFPISLIPPIVYHDILEMFPWFLKHVCLYSMQRVILNNWLALQMFFLLEYIPDMCHLLGRIYIVFANIMQYHCNLGFPKIA